ncbi:hypothetical protein ACGFW5_00310 [Streptomyces sp. NPDC048416]|uniref:hypothetical protein n=1 Tax=Streptomyces sp. NPDC048416 TaxID=3365546 RepID=UPI00370FF40C
MAGTHSSAYVAGTHHSAYVVKAAPNGAQRDPWPHGSTTAAVAVAGQNTGAARMVTTREEFPAPDPLRVTAAITRNAAAAGRRAG